MARLARTRARVGAGILVLAALVTACTQTGHVTVTTTPALKASTMYDPAADRYGAALVTYVEAQATGAYLAAQHAVALYLQAIVPVDPPPAPHPVVTSWPTSLYPCGGDLPPCYVVARESGGNYSAYNATGCSGRSCGGKYQFDPVTWNNYDGYPEAQLAPPAVQDAKAREVWAGGAGCSAWDAC